MAASQDDSMGLFLVWLPSVESHSQERSFRAYMHNIVRITYPFLWVAVFARQLCLPVPAIFFLMTAGALAGRGDLRIGIILAVSTLGCLAADLVWFQAGRRWGIRIIRLLCSLSADPRYCAQRARNSFDRWGLPSVMVVKFLPGLDAITPPLAGAEGVSRAAFLGYDAVGALLWSSLYAGLGYFFADSLDSVAAFLSRFSSAVVLGIGVPLIFYVAWRTLLLVQMIHYLRLRRMSPSELNAKLESEKIAIIDLLDFERWRHQCGDSRSNSNRSNTSPRSFKGGHPQRTGSHPLLLLCGRDYERSGGSRSSPEGNSEGLDIGRRTEGMDPRGLPSHSNSE
jgi:membrane protein DedA with SNARE-associated domain